MGKSSRAYADTVAESLGDRDKYVVQAAIARIAVFS